ncbi:MAG: A/G-specific adenine glycosylase [Bacteroidales bacterium]|nr:A/G-specific adenine glycosylase [Bacteroidales bacterium]
MFKGFQKDLHEWFDENKRNLPWRHTSDPYIIWISEVILQQTTVDQGLDYFNRFVDNFKNVFELAAAKEQDVLKLWQGLGYYSRARNMYQTAGIIVREYKGVFPENHEQLIRLKGIGPYTAAAILSFAFNKPYPVVDGNVMRVVSRLFGITEPINTTLGIKAIKEKTHLIFDKKNPAAFNQAIMEFGALHCKVTNPLCDDCFAKKTCISFNQKIQNLLPVKTPKNINRQRFFLYVIPLIRKESEVYTFIKKRDKKDIWYNLYDFILFESDNEIKPHKIFKTNDFLNTFKSNLNKKNIIHTSKTNIHKLTHQTINTNFIVLETPDFELDSPYIKIKFSEINNYPVPKLIENIVTKLGSADPMDFRTADPNLMGLFHP